MLEVFGFELATPKALQMKSIYDACVAAEVTVPDKVMAFFGHRAPVGAYGDVNIEAALTRNVCAGYRAINVELAKLPAGLKFLQARYTV